MVKRSILIEFVSDDALKTEKDMRIAVVNVLQRKGCKDIKVISRCEDGEYGTNSFNNDFKQ